MPNYLMQVEAAIKNTIKPLFFADETRPRVIRAGLGRGLTMLLNRRNELQKEFGLWEIETQRVYREYVRSEDTVFDVGAGGGDSTLLLAKLAAPGRVVAFEPDATLGRLLEQNMALNSDHAVALDTLVANQVVPAPDFVKVGVEGGAAQNCSRPTGMQFASSEMHGGELCIQNTVPSR